MTKRFFAICAALCVSIAFFSCSTGVSDFPSPIALVSDIYVDGASGDDTTGDGSAERPFKTLEKAIDAGDVRVDQAKRVYATYSAPYTIPYTIYVSGTTAESGSISINNVVSIKGATEGATIGWAGTYTTYGGLITVGADTTISGVTFDGAGATARYCFRVFAPFTMETGAIQNFHSHHVPGCGSVCVSDGGAFTMNGGQISENEDGVRVEGGTFTMNGGSISKNDTWDINNDIVVVEDGTFTMNGGSISENNGCGVISRGTFIMDGGEISGNIYGVSVSPSGTFTMNDGTISGNTGRSINGGGVYVNLGTFTMNGGTISGNTATSGGGVSASGTFTMNGGTISENTAQDGGGVDVYLGTFTMNGGTISGNTATSGGGVYVHRDGTFTMNNGAISGNTATSDYQGGGGVYVNSGTFTYKGTASPYEDANIRNNKKDAQSGKDISGADVYVVFAVTYTAPDGNSGTLGKAIEYVTSNTHSGQTLDDPTIR